MERAPGIATYIWPTTLGWSDLGTPDRLAAWDERPARDSTAGRAVIRPGVPAEDFASWPPGTPPVLPGAGLPTSVAGCS
jgi:hypothetical protein